MAAPTSWSSSTSYPRTTQSARGVPKKVSLEWRAPARSPCLTRPHRFPALSYAFLSSRVAGIVFDSAPAFPDGRTMRAATHSITREQPFSSRVLLYSWAQRRLHGLLRGSHAEQFWAVMERMDWGPLLFLYGRADTASEAHRIDLLVQRKREQGIEVDAQCWPDSGHIEHLRKHPEEYVQKLIAFLRGVDAGERPQAKL